MAQGPDDPTNAFVTEATMVHELYKALLDVEFTEYHALYLAGVALAALIHGGKPS